MHKYGLAARRKRKKYVYPSKATQIAPNLVRELEPDSEQSVVFSDIFEVHLADYSRLRSCFALCKRTRQILGMAFDYLMRADLVTSVIDTLMFQSAGVIWHSDQGMRYGALQTRQLLLQKGFVQSMSRAGTPTDNGYTSALWASSSLLWRNIVPIIPWAIFCEPLKHGSISTIRFVLMKDWDSALPCNMPKSISFIQLLMSPYCSVYYFTGYWTFLKGE